MADDVLRITYVSTAMHPTDQDIEAILETSNRNNIRSGITGVLMFNGINFLQTLEGGDVQVNELIESIKLDPRHSGVTTIRSEHDDKRFFEDFSMAYLSENIGDAVSVLSGVKNSDLDSVYRSFISFSPAPSRSQLAAGTGGP